MVPGTVACVYFGRGAGVPPAPSREVSSSHDTRTAPRRRFPACPLARPFPGRSDGATWISPRALPRHRTCAFPYPAVESIFWRIPSNNLRQSAPSADKTSASIASIASRASINFGKKYPGPGKAPSCGPICSRKKCRGCVVSRPRNAKPTVPEIPHAIHRQRYKLGRFSAHNRSPQRPGKRNADGLQYASVPLYLCSTFSREETPPRHHEMADALWSLHHTARLAYARFDNRLMSVVL